MKKKRSSFFLIISLILITILLLFFVYKVGSFSSFNNIVDSVINRVISALEKNNDENVDNDGISDDLTLTESSFEKYFLITKDIDIAKKEIVFCGIYNGNIPESATKETPGFITDKYAIKTENFTYESKWKFITDPCSYGSYLVVFSGEPSLIIFEWSSGLIYSSSAPVYPDKIILFDADKLVFTGRDGNTYYYDFNGNIHKPTDTTHVISLKNSFSPDSKCTASILSRLEMWTDKRLNDLPPVSFFPSDSNSGLKNTTSLYDRENALAVYAYTPPVQGRYKVGFADENGNWSSCIAFVFAFLQDGEMLNMSFEYYADKPQVEVSLSENELYYFVCGNTDGVEIPENTRIAIKSMF